jgi:hypothetical protein
MKTVRLLLIAVLCWLVFHDGAKYGKRAQFVKDQAEMLDAIHLQQMKDVVECRRLADTSLRVVHETHLLR